MTSKYLKLLSTNIKNENMSSEERVNREIIDMLKKHLDSLINDIRRCSNGNNTL